MTSLSKAKRVEIELGNIPLDGFQMPSGDLRYSGANAVDAIGKHESSLFEFLRGKSPEALPFKGLVFFEKIQYEGHHIPISAYSAEVIAAYWSYHARKGNSKAIALTQACMAEALDRRANRALGIVETHEQVQRVFVERFTFVEGIDFEAMSAGRSRCHSHQILGEGWTKVWQFLNAFYDVHGLPWEEWEGDGRKLMGMPHMEYMRFVVGRYNNELKLWDGQTTPDMSLKVLAELAVKAKRM